MDSPQHSTALLAVLRAQEEEGDVLRRIVRTWVYSQHTQGGAAASTTRSTTWVEAATNYSQYMRGSGGGFDYTQYMGGGGNYPQYVPGWRRQAAHSRRGAG